MHVLARQAALHLGARLASVGLSFFLFAWIGKVLAPSAAAGTYAFTYSLGFGLATARMALQLGAAVDGKARMSERLRHARRGIEILRPLLPLLALGIAAATWANTHSLILAAAAAVVAFFGALDVDLLRGTAGRASLFSAAFASGSVLSLVLLLFVVPPTLDAVCAAVLAQWLPVCAINLPMLKRLRRVRSARTPEVTDIAGTLALAGFDGLVLNAPYIGLFMMPLAISLQLSLVTRVFVASLPMLPLLLHWSNSPAFGQACRRFDLTEHSGFIVALLATGLAAGSVFVAAFVLIAGKTVPVSTVLLYLCLLMGYAIFAPQMRFASARWSKRALLRPLTLSLCAYLAGLQFLAWSGYPHGALAIVILQTAALTATARWLSRARA